MMMNLQKIAKRKDGFGIAEVLVSAVVLGFMYIALLNLQAGNHEALIRIRGRDGAMQVAQQVMDSLKNVGQAGIPSDANKEVVIDNIPPISRSWGRVLDNESESRSSIVYTPVVTVSPTHEYTTTSQSQYESVTRVYAKQVNVKVSWLFKGSTQSINISGVIR